MKKPSVLIIDDDSLFSEVIKTVISPFAEQVIHASSAENGIHFVSKDKPDFIFLDNRLPKLNGTDVIDLYKEISPESHIVLMSNTFLIDDVADAINQKVDLVVAKRQLSEQKISAILNSFRTTRKEDEPAYGNIFSLKNKEKEDGNRNIAIVDDDELFSFQLNWVLNKLKRSASIDSISVYTDSKGLNSSFSQTIPDIIFLDYYLKETNAKYILKYLRKYAPDAKVIIVSSQDDPEIAIELTELTVYGYINKSGDWQARVADYVEELAI
ncbi:MAG: response regulator [Flavobacteriales bacterium]|nr:response regulator [Flavobacteriales bacterium]NNK81458.1 response regulator [Flavobacteriales bacterium]